MMNPLMHMIFMEMSNMNEELFKEVAKIYLSKSAKPLEIEEYKHRGLTCWVFKRKVEKFRPTVQQSHLYRTGKINSFSEIPQEQREYYLDEFWMGISEYFTKYSCEFEYTVEKVIGESLSAEEAKYRLNEFIDKDYAENVMIMEDIP